MHNIHTYTKRSGISNKKNIYKQYVSKQEAVILTPDILFSSRSAVNELITITRQDVKAMWLSLFYSMFTFFYWCEIWFERWCWPNFNGIVLNYVKENCTFMDVCGRCVFYYWILVYSEICLCVAFISVIPAVIKKSITLYYRLICYHIN